MPDKLIGTGTRGLVIDQVFTQRTADQLSYVLNGNLQSMDGHGIAYTNEYSNQLCVSFPAGYRVIGTHLILEKNQILFALVNPITGESEIGQVTNYNCNALTTNNIEHECSTCDKKLESELENLLPCCTYTTIINDLCLGFDIDYPVRMVHKLTNCGFTLYFTDDLNEPRYMDLNDPNGKDSCNQDLPFSCDRIEIFKDFCIPTIYPQSVEGGGNLTAGVYQALLAYSDINGNEYTDYFEATNPVPIFDRTLTNETDYPTNKSIKFKIVHTTELFEYFKLVIIKTVNETSDYIVAGVFKVSTPNTITYTGNDNTLPRTSLAHIRINKPDYKKAKFIEESADHLMMADLEADPDYNLQPLASQLELFWETVQIPYNSQNNYANPIVSSRFRSYMRDEVYPFGIRFKLKNGKKTKAYHIPGRASTSISGITGIDGIPDELIVSPTNRDNVQKVDCDPPENKPYWKIYNTGTNRGGFPPPLNSDTEKICDILQHEQGDFAYWESTEKYPCDPRIWGDLADTPIRYHKFPDSKITHIHDSWNMHRPENTQYDINHNSFIYPIGVRLNDVNFNAVLANTYVFNPETQANDIPASDLICGFELVRGNRVGHKSVIAKGLLYDVGRADEHKGTNPTGKNYYYANYPYNDIRKDAYLANNVDIYDTADQTQAKEDTVRLDGFLHQDNPSFPDDEKFRRFTFHSPDTHFQSPQLGTTLKLETLEFGVQEGHFVKVKDHPMYKFLTKYDSVLATALGTLAAMEVETEAEDEIDVSVTAGARNRHKGTLKFNYAELLATSNLVRDLIEKLIPERNFAYQYNSRGIYNNFIPIENNRGVKIRRIDIGKYLSPNNQHIGDDLPIHNFNRESSVYFKVNEHYTNTLNPYPRGESSRFTLGNPPSGGDVIRGASDWCKNPEQTAETKIRSYYASVKREVPDQYGNIDNINYITTGYTITLNSGTFIQTLYPAFGGDIFINRFALKRKMPFFTQNTVGKPNGTHFDYDLVPNIAFPMFYIGTSPDELKLNEIVTTGDIILLGAGLGALIAGNALSGIASKIANFAGMVALAGAGADIYKNILSAFIPKNNLDCDTTPANLDPSLGDLAGFGDYTLFYQSGKFYLASYGIPQFFVESDVNLEFRHARNPLEENFVPNVGNGIPDEWLQEAEVPILHDNKYNYNATYSVQNYQEFIESFNNYKFDKLCQADFPNRIIYSQKSNNEENFDNWLKFGANNYYDFDKSNGKITGINAIDNNRLLVRFENAFQVWNTTITLQSNSAQDVAVSGSGLFAQDPQEYAKTNTGYGGSQHIAFEKTKAGSFWVNAKLGQVFRFTSNIEEISRTNYNWFKENLPFRILKDFPLVDIDNNFKDLGISICWDERFERLFITKLDYELLPEWKGLQSYADGRFFITDLDVVKGIELSDPKYFSNKSWTIAWSPIISNWVSFYSFLPNYYISHPAHFQTGIHDTLWNHNLSNLSYQTYYNTHYPYILEFPISNIPKSETLKSVAVHNDILKYNTETDFYSLSSVNTENYNIWFTKAIVYNREQCSGTLSLTETPINNMRARMTYPIFNNDNINILYSKNDKRYSFNTFFDITRNYNNGQPMFTDEWSSIQAQYPIDKVLNLDDLSYTNSKKVNIKSNECFVRLIQDEHNRYKFINYFTILNQ